MSVNGLLRRAAGNAIFRNSLFLGLSGSSRGLAEVALVVLVFRALGPATGGQFILGFTVIRIAQYVAEGGLGMYLTREISRRPDLTGTYTMEAIKLVLALTAPVGFSMATVAALLFQPQIGLAIALATVAVIFGAVQPLFGAAFLAQERAYLQFRSMLVMGLTLVAGGLLVATLVPGLLAFFSVIAFSRGAGFAVGLFYFLRRLRPTVALRDLSAGRAFIRGLPYSLNAVGSYLYLRVDIVLLGVISGSLATGIYGSVADPLVSLTSVVYIITYAFLPSLSKAWGDEPERYKFLVKRVLVLNLGLGTLLAVAVFLGSGLYVSLAFGPELAPAAGVLRVLSAAIALRFLNSALATWLTASGRQWYRTTGTLAAAGLNVVVNLVTIPIWGYWAAAWSTVATEAVLSGLLLWFLRSEIWLRPGERGRDMSGVVVHAGSNTRPD